jgi:hypothetical protein
MKRIYAACLNQTIHFQLKPDAPRGVAERNVKAEYKAYKDALHGNKKYKIIDEQTQTDGSIIVKIKKQINSYDVGDYLN